MQESINISVSSELHLPSAEILSETVACILNGRYSISPVTVNVTDFRVLTISNSLSQSAKLNVQIMFQVFFYFPAGSDVSTSCFNMNSFYNSLTTRLSQSLSDSLYFVILKEYCLGQDCSRFRDEIVAIDFQAISLPMVVNSDMCVNTKTTKANAQSSFSQSSLATLAIIFFIILLLCVAIITALSVISRKRKITEKNLEDWIESDMSEVKVASNVKGKTNLRSTPSIKFNDIYSKHIFGQTDFEGQIDAINPVFDNISEQFVEGDIGDREHVKRLHLQARKESIETTTESSAALSERDDLYLLQLYQGVDRESDSSGVVSSSRYENPIFKFSNSNPKQQASNVHDAILSFQQFHHDFISYQGEATSKMRQDPTLEKQEETSYNKEEQVQNEEDLDILDLFSGNDPMNIEMDSKYDN